VIISEERWMLSETFCCLDLQMIEILSAEITLKYYQKDQPHSKKKKEKW
jgi:hypothetical protein